MAKKERTSVLKDVAVLASKDEYFISNDIVFNDIYNAVQIVKKELVRNMIVDNNVRADGRGLNDVRPISIQTNILPSAHSSCLFTNSLSSSLQIIFISILL